MPLDNKINTVNWFHRIAAYKLTIECNETLFRLVSGGILYTEILSYVLWQRINGMGVCSLFFIHSLNFAFSFTDKQCCIFYHYYLAYVFHLHNHLNWVNIGYQLAYMVQRLSRYFFRLFSIVRQQSVSSVHKSIILYSFFESHEQLKIPTEQIEEKNKY